jgi:hypothetical protein
MGDVGGLVGWNSDGTITNSYARGGFAEGGHGGYFGGLVGRAAGTVVSSFWDVDASGVLASAGGESKSTIEMQDPNTFISAGWDFVGESANGTEDIWAICGGTNYPRFVWQIPAADWACPDGVGLEDFGEFAGMWGTSDGGVYLDDEEGIGFGDLKVLCEQWLEGR